MKQVASQISTYTADISGLCSALYELGGMTVMHDASGCNSTFNTHDEPRWYDMDSAVYITAMSEMDAVMGDDEKSIKDIVRAAQELKPRFVAIGGTPIPMMIGTDFDAIARVVTKRTGIPAFGFNTNGMHPYTVGVSKAFKMLAENFVIKEPKKREGKSCNIIGLTPIDFSITGYEKSLKVMLENNGYEVISGWAMGTDLDEIGESGAADVNIVVSWSGLPAAKVLKKRFGTPYVVCCPMGEKLCKEFIETLDKASESRECVNLIAENDRDSDIVIIGESVISGSLAKALKDECGINIKIICPVDTERKFGYIKAEDEVELIPLLENAKIVIADPLYRPICPKEAKFFDLPHFAFSGRIWKNSIPDFIKEFDNIKANILEIIN
ncbi:MAG: nitrogenase component 1 [Clostridia bacterium]|nr:nitrogenase component 1 [Clostridia bacterium]